MVKKRIVENHPNLTFARLVDGIIQAKGIKICELAEAIGCNPKTITRICNGYYHPPKHKVISIGLALGLNINEMNMFLLEITTATIRTTNSTASVATTPHTNSDAHTIDYLHPDIVRQGHLP